MFTAIFYFLGLAGFILATSVCLSAGKRATDGAIRAISNEPTVDERAQWGEMEPLWMMWYGQCRENALLKQSMVYSWARTMVLCAALCLIGVLVEVEFGQPISLRNIVAGLSQSHSAAALAQSPR